MFLHGGVREGLSQVHVFLVLFKSLHVTFLGGLVACSRFKGEKVKDL